MKSLGQRDFPSCLSGVQDPAAVDLDHCFGASVRHQLVLAAGQAEQRPFEPGLVRVLARTGVRVPYRLV